MENARELFDKVYYLCRIRIKMHFKRHSPVIQLIFLLFLFFYPLFFGFLLATGFLVSQVSDFEPPFAYRDLLAFGFLVFFRVKAKS